MDSYKIIWKQSARKELRRLPKEAIHRVLDLVENLANNPYPEGVRKLKGTENSFRIRAGEYRVVYSLQKDLLILEIVRVGHRKNVYQKRS